MLKKSQMCILQRSIKKNISQKQKKILRDRYLQTKISKRQVSSQVKTSEDDTTREEH